MSQDPSEISDAPGVELPGTAGEVAKEKPELWRAFQALGASTGAAGPLSEREQRLVNLALAIGGGSEGATHSHSRRAVAEGLAAAVEARSRAPRQRSPGRRVRRPGLFPCQDWRAVRNVRVVQGREGKGNGVGPDERLMLGAGTARVDPHHLF